MDVINKIEEDSNLNKLINGKKVCLCGPATSNINTDYGNYIDSCDTVCRINWHLTGKNGWDNNYNKDFGKRTDIMFSGIGVFYSALFNDIVNRDNNTSPYNCFKDIKYIYYVDQISSEEFYLPLEKLGYYNNKNFICKPNEYKEKSKEVINNFGEVNINLAYENKLYCQKKFGYNELNKTVTNSGIHAIQTILRHNPSELFITGMNFGNFGKGGTIENMYMDKGHSRRKFNYEERKIVSMKHTIHTNEYTLKLIKSIFTNYSNIKLDNLIRNYLGD